MKILMISGDRHLLKTGSAARERRAAQAGAVERLDTFVWPAVHSAAQIRRAARTTRYDVVTAQDPFWRGLLAWRVARATGARLNLQLHADLAGQSLVKRALGRFLLWRADSVRVVSERLKREVAQYGTRASITVLPVFIDKSRFEGLVHRRHPRFAKSMLWLGRFEIEKDPLEALAILKDVRAQGVEGGLVMLGSGSLDGRLRAAVSRLNLEEWVEFPGWHEPGEYLAMADVVLSTSPYESYGASIVEALAAGVPVVAPDVGVAKEAGAIVVPRRELARAIIDALSSSAKAPEDRRSLLQLPVLSKEEWAQAWQKSLL